MRGQRQSSSAGMKHPTPAAHPQPQAAELSGWPNRLRPVSAVEYGPVRSEGYGKGNMASRYFLTCCKYLLCVISVAVARLQVEYSGLGRGKDGYREVIEAALAHAVTNQTEAAYARSDLFERHGRLVDDCAAYLDKERRQRVSLHR